MMNSALTRQSPPRLWDQLLLVVGHAVGSLTVTSLLALLVAALFRWPGVPCSRADRARLDIKNIAQGLALHRLKQGYYPETHEGLRALVHAGALESVPRDPWNTEYFYAVRNGRPLVWSLGADGLPGGDGEDGDLYSRPLPP